MGLADDMLGVLRGVLLEALLAGELGGGVLDLLPPKKPPKKLPLAPLEALPPEEKEPPLEGALRLPPPP